MEMEGSLSLNGMNLQVKVHRNWTPRWRFVQIYFQQIHLMQRPTGIKANCCKKSDLNPGVFIWTNETTSLRLHKHTNRHSNTRLWLTTLLRVSEEKWKSLSPKIKAVVQIKRSNSSIQIGVCSHTAAFNTAKSDPAKKKHSRRFGCFLLETTLMILKCSWWVQAQRGLHSLPKLPQHKCDQ